MEPFQMDCRCWHHYHCRQHAPPHTFPPLQRHFPAMVGHCAAQHAIKGCPVAASAGPSPSQAFLRPLLSRTPVGAVGCERCSEQRCGPQCVVSAMDL